MLKKCPKCGCKKVINNFHLTTELDFEFRGNKNYRKGGIGRFLWVNKRQKAFCKNFPDCNQKYWFYPRTGRITRRNK